MFLKSILYLLLFYIILFFNTAFGESISLENLEKCFLNPEKCDEYIRLEKSKKSRLKKNKLDLEIPELILKPNTIIGKKAFINGYAKDNDGIAELTINNKFVPLNQDGYFEYSIFIPTQGISLLIKAVDFSGQSITKIVELKRTTKEYKNEIVFSNLDPSKRKVTVKNDALALIVGISKYKNTNSPAIYADFDADMFREYAIEKFGIKANRIKVLINEEAEYGNFLLSIKVWLRRLAIQNVSDIYIFFAGHGLASDNGKNMYLLPYDGRPRLLDDTALMRDRLFKEIKQSNPRSVTVFLDTCYSGVTRNEEMLIAGRPIVIKAKEQAIPEGFTLFSAASNEQISRPLEEAKHGMFSYFLMKGMEGDADANNDNKITARELHAYVEQNVVQQSSGSQTPELQGDKDRVLVQFN